MLFPNDGVLCHAYIFNSVSSHLLIVYFSLCYNSYLSRKIYPVTSRLSANCSAIRSSTAWLVLRSFTRLELSFVLSGIYWSMFSSMYSHLVWPLPFFEDVALFQIYISSLFKIVPSCVYLCLDLQSILLINVFGFLTIPCWF